MKNNKDFFFCYNKNVSRFLKTKGIYHITVAQDPRTKKIFSLFQIDQEGKLQQALDEYKAQTKK